jgi:hypothetical protein
MDSTCNKQGSSVRAIFAGHVARIGETEIVTNIGLENPEEKRPFRRRRRRWEDNGRMGFIEM